MEPIRSWGKRRVVGGYTWNPAFVARANRGSILCFRERARLSHSTHQSSRSPMPSTAPATQTQPFKMWRCLACRLVYDEAEGWPDDGIVAGTRWEDIPAGWC